MITWGWSGMSHDAALAVFKNKKLVFASHSERYSRIKNDEHLNEKIINEALQYGYPDEIHFYENPLLKKTRQIYSGQYNHILSESPSSYLKKFNIHSKIKIGQHHRSHAAAGYYTSKFKDAAILCLDSIGEWETFTIWHGKENNLNKIYSQLYPNSVGLWYSAMTQRLGLKTLEHEYILMGMAALGDSKKYYNNIISDFFKKLPNEKDIKIIFKNNLHKGCLLWRPNLKSQQDYYDIAAATQKIYEEIFVTILLWMKSNIKSNKLILMGGCALNCVANTLSFKYYKNVWIMPNPGDAGSAIGSVLSSWNTHIKFPGPYLGHNIKGKYPIDKIINKLLKNKITAVASGKAEFGPRALGNRSILADPRGKTVKDRVNKIKQREPFRPFAPIILEKYVHKYFNVKKNFKSPYMQFTVECLFPDKFPAIIHYDNTSRVQTINKTDHLELYNLLSKWYKKTGCPMLLNTSLNVKGEPLINSKKDAQRWSKKYGVDICLPS
jgi:carbamoyltransferase